MSNMRCRITTEQLHHIWQQLLRTGLNFIPWRELFQYPNDFTEFLVREDTYALKYWHI